MRFILFCCVSLICTILWAQKPGTWTPHYSFRKVTDLADSPGKIYATCENAVFYYDKINKNTVRLSKGNRLSDIGVGAIAYDSITESVVIGYESGNVDILRGNQTINTPYLKLNKILPTKRIKDIYIHEAKAYLSTDVGIIVLNLKTLEFTDTYFMGNNGSFVDVYQVSINTKSNTIYAATINGLMYAPFSGVNLADFNSWKLKQKEDNTTISTKIEAVVSAGDHTLFCSFEPDSTHLIYSISDNEKAIPFKKQLESFQSLDLFYNKIHLTGKREIYVYNDQLQLKVTEDYSQNNRYDLSQALLDKNGYLWCVDYNNGITNITENYTIVPDGPYNDFVSSIRFYDESKLIASHGKRNSFRTGGYSMFHNNWSSKTLWQSTETLSILKDPYSSEGFYTGSYIGGLHHYENDYTIIDHYDPSNSTLEYAWPGACHVSDIVFDQNNVIWVANTFTPSALKALDREGKWYEFSYPNPDKTTHTKKLFVDQYNNKWATDGSKHLAFVFNENGTLSDKNDDNFASLRFQNGSSESYATTVYTIVEDNEGVIWAGTDNGIANFSNNEDTFEESTVDFQRIKVEVDSIIDYVLEGIAIQSIAVDAGNRKWLGTQNNGVYLLSDDATEFLKNYTAENSALPSNNVHEISIRPSDGEVFFGTSNGVVSLLGDAGAVVEKMEDFKVIPNPVRENYTGTIYIQGFVDNALVRITDLDGNLVYETYSNGGTATWNGLNLLGNRPKTGVYLIFASSEEGEEEVDAQVGKLMFIN